MPSLRLSPPLPLLGQLLRVRFKFDYDYCKGCALCAKQCACGAIDMVPETI